MTTNSVPKYFFILVGQEITIERSDLGPQGTYQQLLESGLLKADSEQTRVVTRLQTLYEEVKNYDKPSSTGSNLFGKLFSFFFGGGSMMNSPRGVYLYGSVGTHPILNSFSLNSNLIITINSLFC